MQLASRLDQIAESITLAVTARANALKKQGVDVVSFGAGEPDFDTPSAIKEAAITALRAGKTKYEPTVGTPEARKAIADKLTRYNKLPYTPEQIIVSVGGKHSLYVAFMAVLNPGDEVLIPAPYWVSYPEMVKLAGGVPVIIHGDPAHEFKITPRQLAAAMTQKTKMFIMNSPSNPGGHTYLPAELAALADVIKPHGNIWVCSDEIYERLLFGDQKTCSWAAMNKLQSQMTSNITSFCMPAIVEALSNPTMEDEVEKMRQAFEKRGAHIWQRLNALPGFKCVRPTGAFYAFPSIADVLGKPIGKAGIKPKDAIEFCRIVLDEAHVALVPGNDFGFPDHVRLSFATSMEQIDKGIDRMEKLLAPAV